MEGNITELQHCSCPASELERQSHKVFILLFYIYVYIYNYIYKLTCIAFVLLVLSHSSVKNNTVYVVPMYFVHME